MRNGTIRQGAARLLFAGLVACLAGCEEKSQPAALVAKTGEATVTILSAAVPKLVRGAPYAISKADGSVQPVLVIRIRVENGSAERAFDYRGWAWHGNLAEALKHLSPGTGPAYGTALVARDEKGNECTQIAFPAGGSHPEGMLCEMQTLDPGKSAEDLLVFEAPRPAAKWITIKLDAPNLGRPGILTLRTCLQIA